MLKQVQSLLLAVAVIFATPLSSFAGGQDPVITAASFESEMVLEGRFRRVDNQWGAPLRITVVEPTETGYTVEMNILDGRNDGEGTKFLTEMVINEDGTVTMQLARAPRVWSLNDGNRILDTRFTGNHLGKPVEYRAFVNAPGVETVTAGN